MSKVFSGSRFLVLVDLHGLGVHKSSVKELWFALQRILTSRAYPQEVLYIIVRKRLSG